jgi:hypothetical protein
VTEGTHLPLQLLRLSFQRDGEISQSTALSKPTRQVDSFNDEDDNFQMSEELARFCIQQHKTEEMLAGAEGSGDPPLHPTATPIGSGANASPRLPRKLLASSSHTTRGKEKLENAAHNLA